MREFRMGQDVWRVVTVPPHDPMLIDRTGSRTVATTDPSTLTVRVSSDITGGFREQVIVHELGHCALHSFGLAEQLGRMAKPGERVNLEELVCNILANYGETVYATAGHLLRDGAFDVALGELARALGG